MRVKTIFRGIALNNYFQIIPSILAYDSNLSFLRKRLIFFHFKIILHISNKLQIRSLLMRMRSKKVTFQIFLARHTFPNFLLQPLWCIVPAAASPLKSSCRATASEKKPFPSFFILSTIFGSCSSSNAHSCLLPPPSTV